MLKVCWWYFELFYQRLLKMMHCHILSMSSFPPTAAIHNLEDSYIIVQNHIWCHFASNSLMTLCSTRTHIKKVLPVASCCYFHNVFFFFFLPVHLLSFTCLPGSTSSPLNFLFGSPLKKEPTLYSVRIQHLHPCP